MTDYLVLKTARARSRGQLVSLVAGRRISDVEFSPAELRAQGVPVVPWSAPMEAIVDSFQGQRPKPNSDADLLALLVAGGLVGGPPNDFAGTAADPTSSTDSSEGWARGSRIHASSGKVWECLSAAINAAVWACLNGPVPHPSSGDAAVLLDPTDDGGQLWLTHAAPTVTVPEDVLRPGFTCEVIAEGASTVITFAGAGSMVVQRPPSFTLSTGERWASVTVTVRDATNAIVRGFLA